MEHKQPITLDDLAAMMKKGFDGVDERLKSLSTAVTNLQEDMKDVKATLQRHGSKLDALDNDVDWMIATLRRLDQERIMESETLRQHDRRIETLEHRVDEFHAAPA